MSRQPTRQLSLQQPLSKKNHSQQQRGQIRRQRSADENRSHGSGSLLYHSVGDQSLKSRREKNNWNSLERPRVRIAWSSTIDDGNKVEVIASRIGTSSSKTVRSNLSSSSSSSSSGVSSSTIGTDKATILYSHQELAERLRVAWKQREANKSNIDIFLAHETTADESRCESRLSTSSCDPVKSDDNFSFNIQSSPPSSSSLQTSVLSNAEQAKNSEEKEVKVILDARSKRASFQSGTNLAFTGGIQKNAFVSPATKDSIVSDKLEKNEKIKERFPTPSTDSKTKRTNSAPPIQRRSTSTLNNIPGSISKAKVNIIIDTPKIGRTKDVYNTLKDVKNDKKDWINSGKINNHNINNHNEDYSNVKGNSALLINHGNASTEKLKPISTKKRARSGKRRVEEPGKKSELSKSNHDVITMVSLVSDADSDSEIERNSPRDDKLVRQLRSNLLTTPIIKSCSPLMMNTGNLILTSNTLENSLMPRRVLKSVSFQQDFIEGEINVRPKSEDKKSTLSNEQDRSVQQIIRGSSAHGDENKTSWYTESSNDIEVLSPIASPSSSSSNYWKECDDPTSTLTDREKRCLVVPIGDPQDKKRKIFSQRTKSVPQRVSCDDNQSTMQIVESKEILSGIAERQLDSRSIHRRGSTGISLQASISKLIQGSSFESSSVDMESIDAVDVQSVEPLLSTTKEKECWHLYRRMCDKGVCVSFDTVLRGMLTPTEYRLRRREII